MSKESDKEKEKEKVSGVVETGGDDREQKLSSMINDMETRHGRHL